ncbi:hypothetical protein T484DRAFT_1827726 [Baffinella frigidus]|nr:hypothetical protein T484DRAFT_1827726 [Cryptophyta sp. CCMP2293]
MAFLQNKFRCPPMVPAEHLESQTEYDETSPGVWEEKPASGGAGVADADLLIYVSAAADGPCADADLLIYVSGAADGPCVSAGAIAYAQACQTDQLDRPVVGYVNVCPGIVVKTQAGQRTSKGFRITHTDKT